MAQHLPELTIKPDYLSSTRGANMGKEGLILDIHMCAGPCEHAPYK